jgi:hypothetical protein
VHAARNSGMSTALAISVKRRAMRSPLAHRR